MDLIKDSLIIIGLASAFHYLFGENIMLSLLDNSIRPEDISGVLSSPLHFGWTTFYLSAGVPALILIINWLRKKKDLSENFIEHVWFAFGIYMAFYIYIALINHQS